MKERKLKERKKFTKEELNTIDLPKLVKKHNADSKNWHFELDES